MPTLAMRYLAWLDLTIELMSSAGREFPRAQIADGLRESFGCLVSWNWAEASGRFGFELQEPVPGFPGAGEAEVWATEGMAIHPLLRWYAASGDPAPMTVGRVPREVVPVRGFCLLHELLAPHGLDQQLSIPHEMTSTSHRAFVLARGGEDFGATDLDLARRIQPMLALLDRQTAALTDVPVDPSTRPAELTSREVAVLRLLADGLTASAIAHRLLVSPRTVHSHLGNIYRKLGVVDRMRAVLVAQELGVLRQPSDRAERFAGRPAGETRFVAVAAGNPLAPGSVRGPAASAVSAPADLSGRSRW
jgi:DNA-binding CsgD family transcriptional regulator